MEPVHLPRKHVVIERFPDQVMAEPTRAAVDLEHLMLNCSLQRTLDFLHRTPTDRG